MTSARVTLTDFKLAVFDGAAKNYLTDEFVVSLFNTAMCPCPWLVSVVRTVRRDWQHFLRNAQRKNCRHKLYKMRNLLLLLLLLCTATFHCRIIAHCRIIVAFCCGLLEVGSPISAFRFSPSHIKNTTPSGDIPRDNYQQHCQYRLRGLRWFAFGLASSIINRSLHISNRWRHILSTKLP